MGCTSDNGAKTSNFTLNSSNNKSAKKPHDNNVIIDKKEEIFDIQIDPSFNDSGEVGGNDGNGPKGDSGMGESNPEETLSAIKIDSPPCHLKKKSKPIKKIEDLYPKLAMIVKNIEANNDNFDSLNHPKKFAKEVDKIFKSFENLESIDEEKVIRPLTNLFLKLMNTNLPEDKLIVDNLLKDILEIKYNDPFELHIVLVDVLRGNISNYIEDEKDEALYIDGIIEEISETNKGFKKKLINVGIPSDNIITFEKFTDICKKTELVLPDKLMEFLLYKMKSDLPKGKGIEKLNCKILFELADKEIINKKEFNNTH